MGNGKFKGIDNPVISNSGTKVSSKMIFTSENSAGDTPLLFDAFNIDWSGYKIGETPITYTGDLIENLGNVIGDGSGDVVNVSVDDEHNSFTVGDVQYTLKIDENGVLYFENYSELKVNSKTPDYTDTLEYGQTNVTGGLTSVSVTCNKAFTGEFSSSNVTVSNNNISGYTLSAATNYTVNYTDNSSKTISATLTETANTSHTIPVTIKINKPTVQVEFCVFGSTDDNFTISGTYQTKPSQFIQSNNIQHFYKKLYNDTSTSFSLTLSNIASNEYLYLLIPANITNHFYVGGSNLAEESSEQGTAKFYGDKNYKLYKCGDSPGNTSVKN